MTHCSLFQRQFGMYTAADCDFFTQAILPLKCYADVNPLLRSCDLRVVPAAWLGQGCVTSEQRDPVPVMKRVQPHRTATLLTCLNYSVWGVNPRLTGHSHLEDYTNREERGQTNREEEVAGWSRTTRGGVMQLEVIVKRAKGCTILTEY